MRSFAVVWCRVKRRDAPSPWAVVKGIVTGFESIKFSIGLTGRMLLSVSRDLARLTAHEREKNSSRCMLLLATSRL